MWYSCVYLQSITSSENELYGQLLGYYRRTNLFLNKFPIAILSTIAKSFNVLMVLVLQLLFLVKLEQEKKLTALSTIFDISQFQF